MAFSLGCSGVRRDPPVPNPTPGENALGVDAQGRTGHVVEVRRRCRDHAEASPRAMLLAVPRLYPGGRFSEC
jgi:hypothetical protein